MKWLNRIEVRDRRAPGPFTTKFYNEIIPKAEQGDGVKKRPVWGIQPNSMIVYPKNGEVFESTNDGIVLWGWTWSEDGINTVEISPDAGITWISSKVHDRVEFSWQRFEATLPMKPGKLILMSRARSRSGLIQPLKDRRNHVHTIEVEVV